MEPKNNKTTKKLDLWLLMVVGLCSAINRLKRKHVFGRWNEMKRERHRPIIIIRFNAYAIILTTCSAKLSALGKQKSISRRRRRTSYTVNKTNTPGAANKSRWMEGILESKHSRAEFTITEFYRRKDQWFKSCFKKSVPLHRLIL